MDLTVHVGLLAAIHELPVIHEVMQRLDEIMWGIYNQTVVSLLERNPSLISIFRSMHSCKKHFVPLDIVPLNTFRGLMGEDWKSDLIDLVETQLINGWVDPNGTELLVSWDSNWEIP